MQIGAIAPARRELRRAGRFVLVGLSSTALDFGLLAVFTWLGAGALAANTLAFGIATVYNFAVSRAWTYAGTARRPLGRQFAAYLGTNAVALLLNDAALLLAERLLLALFGAPMLPVAKLAATGAAAVWSYITNRLLVFRDAAPSDTPHPHTCQTVSL